MPSLIKSRWLIAVAGIVLQMCLGTVYGWSIFVKPFEAVYGWHKPDVTLAFSIAIACLGLAAAAGGFLLDRFGPRVIAVTGSLLFGFGILLTGWAASVGSLPLIYLFYGVMAGTGLGMAYITPISVLIKWFPDKRGLITGLAVMGFGFGAFFMTMFAPELIVYLSNAKGAVNSAGLSQSFYLLGCVFLVLTFVAALFFRDPPQGFAPVRLDSAASAEPKRGMDAASALKEKTFYLYWAILFVNIAAGIALISLASPFLQESFGKSAAEAGALVGIFSVFNGLGRLFWSWLSDRIGRRTVFLIFFAAQAVVFAALPFVDQLWLFVVCGSFIYSCYGGGFSTMPAFAADTFGSRHIGTIYGFMLTAWSAAALAGPLAFAAIVQNNSWIIAGLSGYDLAFAAAGLLFTLALIIPLRLKIRTLEK